MLRTSASLALLLSIPVSALAQEFRANDLLVAVHGDARIASLRPPESGIGLVEAAPGLPSASPRALAFAPDGRLYVSSGGSVWVHDADGAATLAFNLGTADLRGLAFCDGGDLLVLTGFGVLYRYRATEAGLVWDKTMSVPGADQRALTVSPEGTIYIGARGVILELDRDGDLIREIPLPTTQDLPYALAFGRNGHLYAAMHLAYTPGGMQKEDCVYEYIASGMYLQSIGEGSGLKRASGLAFGPDGKLYVSSYEGDRIHVYDPETLVELGEIMVTGFDRPYGLAFAPQRFKGKLSGAFTGSGDKLRKLSESVVVSVSPGSNCVMVDFPKLADSDDGFDDEFVQRAMVFRGFESKLDDQTSKKRVLGGTQIGNFLSGFGSLSVIASGKVDEVGYYKIKSLKGAIGRHGASGGWNATLKTSKQLNKD